MRGLAESAEGDELVAAAAAEPVVVGAVLGRFGEAPGTTLSATPD